MENNINRKRERISVFLSLFCSIIFIYILFICLPLIMQVTDRSDEIEKIFAVNASSFTPEPIEQTGFILSVFLFPILSFGLLKLFNYIQLDISKRTINKIYLYINIAFIIGMYSLFWFSFKSNNFLYLKQNIMFTNPFMTVIFSILLMFYVLFCEKKDKTINNKIKICIEVSVITVISVISISVVYSVYYINDGSMFTSHFNAVFHSVSAVYLDKTLLVDFYNQYGQYPHFLEPIFRVIGLSVFKFTMLMGVILGVSFYFLYKVMNMIIPNKIILLLGFGAVLFNGYVQQSFLGDPYFQYYPIRLVFPAILLCCAAIYFKRPKPVTYYILFVLFSVGVLWNLDTGLIVFIAWLLVLIFAEIIKRNEVKNTIILCIKHLSTAAVTLIIVILSYTVYIWMRSGVLPNYLDFFAYQSYFYGFGFYMLPMRVVHPWNFVILIYMIGLLTSIQAMIKKKDTIQIKMIFLLSILGTGLFLYYQGRSHDYVLRVVWYPAIILLTIFTSQLLHQFKDNKASSLKYMHVMVLCPLLFALLSSAISLVVSIPTFFHTINLRGQSYFQANHPETSITTGIAFIKENTKKGEETIILSFHSGVYYLYTETVPLLNIPGTSELFLKQDYGKIEQAIDEGASKIFVDKNFIGLGENHEYNMKLLNQMINKNYTITNKSENGNIFLFEKNLSRSDLTSVENGILSANNHNHYILNKDLVFNSVTKDFVGMSDSIAPISLGFSYYLELLIKPGEEQINNAAILGNHPGNGFEGFVVQQNNEKQNIYTFSFGNGANWNISEEFRLDADKWSYLVVSVLENTISIYINGDLVSTHEANGTIKNSSMNLSIGNWLYGDRTFNGIIREVNIGEGAISKDLINMTWNRVKEEMNSFEK
ncbi:LamG domain-containing protein [Paenibacillus dendritiformis]|uniref:LamG domain-containing protein n=1 Tax=Paenibacillus dendritiformis TaxID=130049 RepID=UPI00248AD58A|nr:LamG domain-containing protein [Paenibacillus dendritiformis]WGU93815.1 LamG domain-containing protein [Paenibacillus dendritiformis]